MASQAPKSFGCLEPSVLSALRSYQRSSPSYLSPTVMSAPFIKSRSLHTSLRPLSRIPRNHDHVVSRLSSRSFHSASTRVVAINRSTLKDQVGFFVRPRQLQSVRHITVFGSTFSRARLSALERLANSDRQDPHVQWTFYNALLRNDLSELLVERYETGRFATNDACEKLYTQALEQVGRGGKIPTISGASQLRVNNGLTAEQLQGMSQAAVAHTHGTATAARGVAQLNGTGAKSSPIHVVVEDSYGGLFFKWVRFIVTTALYAYVFFVMLSFILDTATSMTKMLPKQNNEAKPEHQKVKFSDVHGCDEAKDELQDIVEFLRDPDKFASLGGRLPKGVLLIGPPGTGKTLLARAVAGEAGVPFFFASGSEFDEVFVGVGAKRIRELFQAARSKAPAIVFIDELDAVGGKRNAKDVAYSKQTLNQLLTELDGFAKDSSIIVIAATNLPKLLDPALVRPGRFDRHVDVALPDVRGRMAILGHHMKGVKMSDEVDTSKLARTTTGFSGADLENLVNQAAVHAGKSKGKAVTMQDLEWAKDKLTLGAEKRSMIVQPKDKLSTAYHEAGHTLMAIYTAGADPLHKVTIMPRGQALGITYQMPEMDAVSHTKKQMLAKIDVCMGGKVAEQLIYGPENVSSGAASDLKQATRIAYMMVTQLGMSEKIGNMDLSNKNVSTESLHLAESEVRRLLDTGYSRAESLLTERRVELEIVAQALMEYETLTDEEVKKVIRGEKLANRLKVDPNAPMKIPQKFKWPAHGEAPGQGVTPVPEVKPGGGPGGATL
ncbi:MAG: hypothetical protein M1814_002144 [Vezdaea aestivalis]|nr:MAG: hypothetical protein M1814_002144 [Vezdaea aestivalis]